jgi:alpha-aminoadipic semialdehyde synthase
MQGWGKFFMSKILGIRREDKNKWEKRVPIIPEHIKELKEKYGIDTIIQPSPIRAFSDETYRKAYATVKEELSPNVIFAIKEIPINFFQPNKTYLFFSHTIKGQEHNIPMLKKMMELNCNMIDYEKIANEKGRRLIFFGRYAGIAGMIDSLWAFGQRLKWLGIKSSFSEIKQTIHYHDLDHAKEHIREIGEKIKKEGISHSISPIVVGFAGYGNVSLGAQEILDILPVKDISPKELEDLSSNYTDNLVYKVVFKEKDMVEPKSSDREFILQEYYNSPHLYQPIFQRYIPALTILMNCIFWNEKYPRLVTKDYLKKNYSEDMKLQVIGDISVDINGAIEFTEKVTTPDNPVFTYNPKSDEIIDGYKAEGIVLLAVDNLPCEIPKESSREFSNSLLSFIPKIVEADYSVDFDELDLPDEIKKAVILYHGKLTPDYQYMNKFL